MKKVAVVITARASYARVKTVLQAIQDSPDLELFLIGGGSLLLYKYGNAAEVIERDGFKIDEKVYMIIEGENPATMAKSVGVGVMELATIFDNSKPDLVISVADRFETISTAISASYLNIPVVHLQGGEVSGSIDEKVRHATTKFSSLHLVSNEQAKHRVRLMGEAEESIFVTGCPSIDLAKEVRENSDFMNTAYLYSKYGGTGAQVDIDKDFLVVLQHPVTTEFEEAYVQMQQTLMAVHSAGVPVILLWPNVDAGTDHMSKAIREFREKINPPNFHFFRNIEPQDFLALLMRSKCLVGNSSVGIRECSYLGVPVVNIGGRQEGRERGENVIDVPAARTEILQAIKRHLSRENFFPGDTLYGDGTAGEKIARILSEVTPSVHKKFVEWKEEPWKSLGSSRPVVVQGE